jgi:hypothetical protein
VRGPHLLASAGGNWPSDPQYGRSLREIGYSDGRRLPKLCRDASSGRWPRSPLCGRPPTSSMQRPKPRSPAAGQRRVERDRRSRQPPPHHGPDAGWLGLVVLRALFPPMVAQRRRRRRTSSGHVNGSSYREAYSRTRTAPDSTPPWTRRGPYRTRHLDGAATSHRSTSSSLVV